MAERGAESLKVQLEADMTKVVDALNAVTDVQDWALTLARRRWRVSDGEELQEYIHRLESGLIVVYRWMRLLRRRLPTVRIARLLDYHEEAGPSKEDSGTAAV